MCHAARWLWTEKVKLSFALSGSRGLLRCSQSRGIKEQLKHVSCSTTAHAFATGGEKYRKGTNPPLFQAAPSNDRLLLVFAAFHAAHHQKNERTLKSHRIFFSFASNPSWLLTSPPGLSSRTVPSHEQRNLVSSKSRCAVITKHALDSEDVIEK